jgi:hypothetical protein
MNIHRAIDLATGQTVIIEQTTNCHHLNPIERLWGDVHDSVTHNHCYATRKAFCEAILAVLTRTVPEQFHRFRSRISDNFRVIEASGFRVLT